MYGKLFSSMYDGTLADDWQALVTFQQMICLADDAGVLDMTAKAISNRTGIPIDIIENGIKVLEAPDPYSRTPDNDGVRIERLDAHRPWGWQITNYIKYRQLASHEEKKAADRDRIAKKRAACRKESRPVAECSDLSQGVADVAHTDRDTDRDKEIGTDVPMSKSKLSTCPHLEIIELYHEVLPELPRIVASKWSGSQDARSLQMRWREDPKHQSLDFWRDLFAVVRTNPHWMGKNNSGWCATLRWMVKKENFTKVYEWGVNHG